MRVFRFFCEPLLAIWKRKPGHDSPCAEPSQTEAMGRTSAEEPPQKPVFRVGQELYLYYGFVYEWIRIIEILKTPKGVVSYFIGEVGTDG
jgi:hypothetical protein